MLIINYTLYYIYSTMPPAESDQKAAVAGMHVRAAALSGVTWQSVSWEQRCTGQMELSHSCRKKLHPSVLHDVNRHAISAAALPSLTLTCILKRACVLLGSSSSLEINDRSPGKTAPCTSIFRRRIKAEPGTAATETYLPA